MDSEIKMLVLTIKRLVEEQPSTTRGWAETRNKVLQVAENENAGSELQEFLAWFGH